MPSSTSKHQLRKGLWTAEEDILLKNCISKYGEGKWHLVPIRTGLKRCRKSCRLRWLNYLKPDIKRGDFGSDEVDLLLRLHKLLGNRWSLIAGRLPGRTANDVKNYWNTHLLKTTMATMDLPETRSGRRKGPAAAATNYINNKSGKTTVVRPIASTLVLKPRPQTFSKKVDDFVIKGKASDIDQPVKDSAPIVPISLQNDKDGSGNETRIQYWWDALFSDKDDQEVTAWSPLPSSHGAATSSMEDNDLMNCPFPVEAFEELKDGSCDNNQEEEGGWLGSGCLSPGSEFWDMLFSDP